MKSTRILCLKFCFCKPNDDYLLYQTLLRMFSSNGINTVRITSSWSISCCSLFYWLYIASIALVTLITLYHPREQSTCYWKFPWQYANVSTFLIFIHVWHILSVENSILQCPFRTSFKNWNKEWLISNATHYKFPTVLLL